MRVNRMAESVTAVILALACVPGVSAPAGGGVDSRMKPAMESVEHGDIYTAGELFAGIIDDIGRGREVPLGDRELLALQVYVSDYMVGARSRGQGGCVSGQLEGFRSKLSGIIVSRCRDVRVRVLADCYHWRNLGLTDSITGRLAGDDRMYRETVRYARETAADARFPVLFKAGLLNLVADMRLLAGENMTGVMKEYDNILRVAAKFNLAECRECDYISADAQLVTGVARKAQSLNWYLVNVGDPPDFTKLTNEPTDGRARPPNSMVFLVYRPKWIRENINKLLVISSSNRYVEGWLGEVILGAGMDCMLPVANAYTAVSCEDPVYSGCCDSAEAQCSACRHGCWLMNLLIELRKRNGEQALRTLLKVYDSLDDTIKVRYEPVFTCEANKMLIDVYQNCRNSHSPRTREVCLDCLFKLRPANLGEILMDCMGDFYPEVRARCRQFMSNDGAYRWAPMYVDLLGKDRYHVDVKVQSALATMGNDALQYLKNGYYKKGQTLRSKASIMRTLGRIVTDESFDIIERMLVENEDELSDYKAKALWSANAVRAVPIFNRLLKEKGDDYPGRLFMARAVRGEVPR